jgi:hypothetical protein
MSGLKKMGKEERNDQNWTQSVQLENCSSNICNPTSIIDSTRIFAGPWPLPLGSHQHVKLKSSLLSLTATRKADREVHFRHRGRGAKIGPFKETPGEEGRGGRK